MNRRRLRSFILIFTPQLGIGLHQGLFVERILNLHFRLSSHFNAKLQNNMGNQVAERETGTTVISGLQHNTKNMLAQAERQSQADGIQELSPLQNQITPPNNRLEVVLDNLCEHAVQGRQSTNPDSRSSLRTLWDSTKELLELIQRRSQHNFIEGTGRNLKHWHPNNLADDLRINHNNRPHNSRLKNNATVLILHYL